MYAVHGRNQFPENAEYENLSPGIASSQQKGLRADLYLKLAPLRCSAFVFSFFISKVQWHLSRGLDGGMCLCAWHISYYTHDRYLTETASQGNLGRTSEIILGSQTRKVGTTFTFWETHKTRI